MDRTEKRFNRNLNNYHRYRFYGKEAKVALKLVRRLEESFTDTQRQTERFLNQLVRLCTCKSDNVLLRRLGMDIALVSSEFRRANGHHKETFGSLIGQLTQISEQFDGVEKVEAKYKIVHCNRVAYERRPKGLVNILTRLFSIRAHRSDDEFASLDNLQNDYLNNYTDKPVDRKLAKLVKEENNLEQSLVTHCLNQELATVIRIRKLVKIFAENQVQYERDLILLFSQLDMVAEQDVPEVILGLNNKELDEYFRPKNSRSHAVMPPLYSGDQPTVATKTLAHAPEQANYHYNQKVPNCSRLPTDLQKSYSLDSQFKNQMGKLNNPQAKQSPGQQKPTGRATGLYYGSLCSLTDKNFVCELCNPTNVDALMNETSYHRCKLNHGQEKQPPTKFNPDELTNIDLTTSHLSPSASAPPIDVSEWPVNEKRSPAKASNSVGNQIDFCKNCNGYCYQLCKVEEAALAFLASYRNFKSQMGSFEFKQLSDQLPKGF